MQLPARNKALPFCLSVYAVLPAVVLEAAALQALLAGRGAGCQPVPFSSAVSCPVTHTMSLG
jgi:hypothetical protein